MFPTALLLPQTPVWGSFLILFTLLRTPLLLHFCLPKSFSVFQDPTLSPSPGDLSQCSYMDKSLCFLKLYPDLRRLWKTQWTGPWHSLLTLDHKNLLSSTPGEQGPESQDYVTLTSKLAVFTHGASTSSLWQRRVAQGFYELSEYTQHVGLWVLTLPV